MGLADSVFRLFRENSDVVPINRLKKQGVKNVTVLDWGRIQNLIEKAVDEALSRRNIELAPNVLAGVHREAREAFHRLLEQRDRLEETARTLEQEKADLSKNVVELRGEIARSEEQLAKERSRAVEYADVAVEGAQLDHALLKLEERVRAMAPQAGTTDAADFAARIAAAAKSLLDEERRRAFDQASNEHRLKVEQLERRVSKLQRTLNETEEVVERLKTAKEGDPGIESVYKSVQGLDPKDQRAREKRGLLDQVFKLNLELREVIAESQTAGTKSNETRESATTT